MKYSLKKAIAVVVSAYMMFSCFNCVNVFAKDNNIVCFDEKGNKSDVSSLPDGQPVISVVPSNDELTIGDTFYVDFVLKNNPGFAAFGFTIDYNADVIMPVDCDANAAEVTYNGGKTAISAKGIENGINLNKKGIFSYTNILLSDENTASPAENDGILFRVNFKAVGNGSSEINLSDRAKVVLGSVKAEIIPTYVKNAIVTVSASSSSSESQTSETVTDTDTDSDTDSDTNTNTNTNTSINTTKTTTTTTTEKTTEATTVTTTEKATEETTIASEKESEKVSTDSSETNNSLPLNIPVQAGELKTFADVTENTPWAEAAISRLSSLGIINGIDDDVFAPKENTCRADFVIVISRLLGLDINAENVFDDVENGAYYADAIAMATSVGLVNGSNGNFAPKDNITRQDVMVIISRILEKTGKLSVSENNVLDNFYDGSDVSEYAKKAVSSLVSMGIVNGNADGSLNPLSYISRAEMAVIINRVYDELLN